MAYAEAVRFEELPPMPSKARNELAERVVQAAKLTFGEGLLAAIGKGSAFKGDFVPFYSDFDVHLFIDGTTVQMLDARTPALKVALAFQRAIGAIEPEAYGVNSVQAYVVDAERYPKDWTPPLPGTYRVLHETYPKSLTVPTSEELIAKSRAFFPWIRTTIPGLIGRIVDKPDSGLAPYVRYLGTSLKPAVYHAATLQGADPVAVWAQPLARVVGMVGDSEAEAAFTYFFGEVQHWEGVRKDAEQLRTMFEVGAKGLEQLCASVLKG